MILHAANETARNIIPYDEDVVIMLGDYYSTPWGLSIIYLN